MSKALGGTRDDFDSDRKRVRDPVLFLEEPCEVTCSKYMSKTKASGTEAFSNSQQAFKVCNWKRKLKRCFSVINVKRQDTQIWTGCSLSNR